MEIKGVKVNINKTKVMISVESHKGVQNTGRWPCVVCGRGVIRNSIWVQSVRSWWTISVVV